MKRFVRLLLAFSIGIVAVLLTESTIGGKKINTTLKEFSPTMERQARQLVTRIVPTPTPTVTPLDSVTLINLINEKRTENNLNALKLGKQTCAVLHMYTERRYLTTDQIHTACPTCKSLNIYALLEPVTKASFLETAAADASISAIFKNKQITHTCSESANGSLFLATVEVDSAPVVPVQPKDISEDELWQALSEYRKDHQVPELSRDEKLCVYARKRLDDQQVLLKENKPAESYPVPAKYPLDAHDGFKKDADSGYVFEVTNRSVVAENLAYWPTATYGVHVIEWGWDTSTEGHKETQLSKEYTAACVTGRQGFYVAIFAK